jgi:hypothetical protein
MALLAQPATAKLPPLEALFTLEEEIGLNGRCCWRLKLLAILGL